MFVLGIDPGVTRCGYGCVHRAAGGAATAAAAGVLTTATTDALPARLATLQADLAALLADLRPDVVVVERVLFSANARTAMATGQASGLALALAHAAGCTVATYSPNEVKLAVAGHGGADKQQVQRMVATLLGLAEAPKPADAADALALALTHLAQARLPALAAAGATHPSGGHAGVAGGRGGRGGRGGLGGHGAAGAARTAPPAAGLRSLPGPRRSP